MNVSALLLLCLTLVVEVGTRSNRRRGNNILSSAASLANTAILGGDTGKKQVKLSIY